MYENHDFHIPVMGTGFSADLPLKVGRYGVSSVVSLVDDRLLEQLGTHYAAEAGVPYEKISSRDEDSRARRITAYFDFLQEQLDQQVEGLRSLPFTAGSDLTRYFELLPEGELRTAYEAMLELPEGAEKRAFQDRLRTRVVPGTIDANIMTKIDRQCDAKGVLRPSEDSDALSGLRGFARSKARGSVVFSAGLNARLYGYTASFDCFYPDEAGNFEKQIVLKVSDHRSAAIQGKFCAKRGIWISEYRIEAGLNCGGHAFPADGQLIGVILETFKRKRDELREELYGIWRKTLEEMGRPVPSEAPELRVTVQGGIGTAAEHQFLLRRFDVEATGWASPFLLVPEVIALDEDTRGRLLRATREDIQLSWSSPLQVRYWNLMSSASEDDRRERIAADRPGSPCPKGFLGADRTYGEVPQCRAAREYQKRQLTAPCDGTCSEARAEIEARMLAKSCICHELGGGILGGLGIDPKTSAAVCPGPNLTSFSRLASLDDMIGHIYGRNDLLQEVQRPHVFVAELKLNLDYLREEIEDFNRGLSDRKTEYFARSRENLRTGIEFYRVLAADMGPDGETFLEELEAVASELADLPMAA
jgi:hypothetical protein